MAGELANPVLIDTTILIDHFRRRNKAETWLFRLCAQRSLKISAVTVFEFGAGLSGKGRDYALSLMADMEVLAFDKPCAEAAALSAQQLRKAGEQIAPPDLFISATAIVHRLPLATLNRRHFLPVQGLTLLEP